MGEVFELFKKQRIEAWITLAHVCRRWRSVVFQSPRRLNLRLLCTHRTRARDILDVWPPLPLIIHDSYDILNHRNGTSGVDDITAALEHNDRVCQIKLRYLTSSQLEYLTDSAAMQKPFPELTDLAPPHICRRWTGTNTSRFVLRRNRTASAIILLG